MVVYELVQWLADLIAPLLGIEGVLVTGLASTAVALYYLRETAGVLVVLARWARIASVIIAILSIVLAAGAHLGIVDLAGGSLVEQAGNWIAEGIH
ncbi:hypothetical protein IL252_11140 [Halomicrobium sp. IBSBa]|uniref:hypothetical protein n=1 Tax=Halomicrobium sp. IBSBa TaxID=2778916 RepID=UPI001ABFD261|nr:hypothetical protein [Halomicrobium sp. IBSBa]MBO4248368.1 hypothetical protein [Halomicrobium sp. IBSBa]